MSIQSSNSFSRVRKGVFAPATRSAASKLGIDRRGVETVRSSSKIDRLIEPRRADRWVLRHGFDSHFRLDVTD